VSTVEFDEAHFTRPPPKISSASAETLARHLAHRYGLTVDQILGPGRRKHVMSARRELYRMLRERGWSYPAIGEFCGGRNHSTIMVALGAKLRAVK
jgi:chromosomal replication initiation ATPase DnaA